MAKYQFEGKVALVTGGASGIGRATAQEFSRQGASVIVADIEDKSGEETASLIRETGGEAIYQTCDVTNSSEVMAAVNRAIQEFGQLDFACNNAGVSGMQSPIYDYPEEEWNRIIEVNLTGVWLSMKYEISQMLQSGGGSIVNVSSILGKAGFAHSSAEVAAKHGVLGLSKTAALEHAHQGIRVNAVCPAFIYTPMLVEGGIQEGSDLYEIFAGLHPVKRLGNPEEVAGAVVWLCSNAASFVTGATLDIDGGYLAQ